MKRIFLLQKLLFLLILFSLSSCCHDDEEELHFIGDSIVGNWDIRLFFPNYITENHGIGKTGLSHIIDYHNKLKGKRVVVLTGTNDLTNEGIKDSLYSIKYIHAIEGLAASDVNIISILPRQYESDKEEINSIIKKLNNDIKRGALSKGWNYIDVFDAFLLDNGINHEYYFDGLHLTNEGYEVLSYLVKKEL